MAGVTAVPSHPIMKSCPIALRIRQTMGFAEEMQLTDLDPARRDSAHRMLPSLPQRSELVCFG